MFETLFYFTGLLTWAFIIYGAYFTYKHPAIVGMARGVITMFGNKKPQTQVSLDELLSATPKVKMQPPVESDGEEDQ